MTAILFQTVSFAILPFWLLMIALPHWRMTRWIIRSPWILIPLPLLYVILVIPQIPEVLPLLFQPKLDDIAGFLSRPQAALVGWIHWLAFDLFVGRWIYLDSGERQITGWLTAPALFLTLLFGPCGLLAYLALRLWWPDPCPSLRQRINSSQVVKSE